MHLKKEFTQLIRTYTSNDSIIESYWQEIQGRYTNKKRHYHTLVHLEALIRQLSGFRPLIEDWNTLLFSIYYHDIVYNVLKSDNEERSAELAVKRLADINYPDDKINICKESILCTKNHAYHGNGDINFFTDADLSILGQPQDLYEQYCDQIRREYAIYPDIVYNPARKKVLSHFLNMERIFKTEPFYIKFEVQARLNLQAEADRL